MTIEYVEGDSGEHAEEKMIDSGRVDHVGERSGLEGIDRAIRIFEGRYVQIAEQHPEYDFV